MDGETIPRRGGGVLWAGGHELRYIPELLAAHGRAEHALPFVHYWRIQDREPLLE